MSKYDQFFGDEWESLEEEKAVNRAYALGVAASLGEYHPDELDAIRAEVSTAYSRSLVDLAFDKGKSEGMEVKSSTDHEDEEDTWERLVTGEPPEIDDDQGDSPTGGRLGLPENLNDPDFLDIPSRTDHTEAIERPDFLERD